MKIITCIFPAALGGLLAVIGYSVLTWQFWAIMFLAFAWVVSSSVAAQ